LLNCFYFIQLRLFSVFVMSFEISQYSDNQEYQGRKELFYLKVSKDMKNLKVRVNDIFQFIQHALYGQAVTVRPLFASLSSWQLLRCYVLILIQSSEKRTFFQYKWSILNKGKFYVYRAHFEGAHQFWKNILRMPYKMYGPTTPPFGDPGCKVPLVLTLEEMISLNYTVPSASIDENSMQFSLPFYTALSDRSPVFAIDCEMVKVGPDSPALSRLSIVNENYEVLLDVLVKPDKQITDYVTKYSGMTPQLLEGVTLRLEDVQHYLRKILPPNAILVGHSINYDMDALGLYHPYLVDIGFTLNLNENSALRTSLHRLCERILGLSVQEGMGGHCSIEDAYATMRLFHLKLSEGGQYGCVPLGWKRELKEILDKVEAKKENVDESGVDENVNCTICNKSMKMICTNANCQCRKLKKIIKCQECMNSSGCKDQLPPHLEAVHLKERIAAIDSFKMATEMVLKSREKSLAVFQEEEREKCEKKLNKHTGLPAFRQRGVLYLQGRKQDCMLCNDIDSHRNCVEHFHVVNDKKRMDYLISDHLDHPFRVNECEISNLQEQRAVDQQMCSIIDRFPPRTMFNICFINGEKSKFVFALSGQDRKPPPFRRMR
ncbi:putative exonuclease -like protein, partial [Trichinella nelsoni]